MNARYFLFLLPALAATMLTAQEKKPAPPKVPSHAPTQSKLNKIRQDERVQKELKKAKEIIEKAGKNSEGVKREAERMQKEKSPATTDEVKSKLEKLKDSVDKNDLKELEALLKDSTSDIKEEIKKYRDQKRKETVPAPSVNPVPDTTPVPGSFDSIAAAEPIPLAKAPVFPVPPIRADHAIKGPSRDPRDPEKKLPESDLRTRTWVLSGDVRIRRPTEAVDADVVEIVFKQGESPDSSGKSGKPASPPGVDPINRPKNDESDIESIVARGRVRFMIVDAAGRVQVGRGGHMTWEEKTGWFVIKDWPEAELGGRRLKGRTKNAVIRLSRLDEVNISGLDLDTLERELTPNDLPKTADKPVPGAGPVLPKPSAAPSPAPR